jgi:dimethylaniline monooxygenase (N-oxide forming)
MPVRVAIVGAGPLGLMALKNLREAGFEATAYDRRSYVGGLWKQSTDATVSITPNTRFNSSRFVSAITDFPFPDHYDDFPTGAQLFEYLNLYCDHFNLRDHIRLSTEVVDLRRVDGKWELTTSPQGANSQVEYFDKVVTATGSFCTPRTPQIESIDSFQGRKLHSISFPHPRAFKDHNVLLVGLHATAQDLTVELSEYASKVYIAHRSGAVLVSHTPHPRFF